MGKSTSMTEGSIAKQLIRFAVPLILGNLFQQLYNTVDSIIVGNYIGKHALAAVGACGALIDLMLAFCIGASVGAGVVISQHYGANDENGVEKAVHTTLAIAVVFGIVMMAVGIIAAPVVLGWMGTPEDVLPQSVIYMRIFFGGMLFSVVYNYAAGILNAVGNSAKALQYLMIAAGSNIVLDWIFVVIFHMGVEGVALATDIGQFISCVCILRYMMNSTDLYRVKIRKIRLDKMMALKIIKIGIPAGIQNMVISFSNVVIQANVNSFGSDLMAAFAAYIKIDGFNILPVMSFGMAATTFAGQNVGAKRYDRVRKGVFVSVGMGVIYAICSGTLLFTFGGNILHIFVDDPKVVELGVYILKFFCPFYFVLSIMQILAGSIRGTGKTLPPMFIIIFALCIYRIIWLGITVPMFREMKWVFMAYPISWIIGASLMVLYACKAKWIPSD